MLALALTAERFGRLPSELIKLSPVDLDFNLTCGYRLLLNDVERQQKEKEAIENGGGGEQPKGFIKGKITPETLRW